MCVYRHSLTTLAQCVSSVCVLSIDKSLNNEHASSAFFIKMLAQCVYIDNSLNTLAQRVAIDNSLNTLAQRVAIDNSLNTLAQRVAIDIL